MMMEPEVEALGEEATVVQESYTMGCAVGDRCNAAEAFIADSVNGAMG